MRHEIINFKNIVNGTDIYLIGGGYTFSEQMVDLHFFNNKNIIAINDAYKLFPNALALYWADSTWADKNYKGLDNHTSKFKFTQRKMTKSKIIKHKTSYDAILLKNTGDFGYEADLDCVRGNNSGTQALNFIINLNPAKIYLLGFDMKIINEKTNWHNNHTIIENDKTYTSFIKSMNSLAAALSDTTKEKIINCSPDSNLECFTKQQLIYN